MSIFNVGTGREPAEIGVAEYQKPDYQQFEKLANVNMQLKQAELEKAQKKTKEWGDILGADYSTKYGIEQIQAIQTGKQQIMDDLMKDIQGNPEKLNDPVTIMQVKARFDQLKGKVKTFDVQSENIFNLRKEVNDDAKGIKYDKEYAIEFFKAQDNPIEYYKNNTDSEFGKVLGGIINSPEVTAIKDETDKRMVIRSAMQGMPLKRGSINIPLKIEGKPLQDISRPYADKNGKRTTYDEVSPVSALVFTMNAHRNGANENIPYREYTKRKLMEQTGENGYNDYLSKLKDDYTNNYNAMAKDYAGEEITMGKFNELPKPENLTEGDLLDYSWGKPESANFTTKTARESQTTNVSVRTGDGAKNATNSNTINTVFKLPTQGRFSNIDVTTTTIDPLNTTENVVFNNIYSITGGGYMQRQESSTTTGNLTAPMGQVQVGLLPVHIGKKDPNGFPVPLTGEEQKDMVNNPNNWRGKVTFKTSFMSNSVTTQNGSKKIDSSVAFASENMKALNTIVKEAKKQGFKQFVPTKPDYSFDEGLKYYNDYKTIQAPNSF